MSIPLASIMRQSVSVWIYRPHSLPTGLPKDPLINTAADAETRADDFNTRITSRFNPEMGKRIVFSHPRDAETYLRFWKNEVSAMSQLRLVLYKSGESSKVCACNDEEVIRILAGKVASNMLALTEGTLYRPALGRLVVPAQPPLPEEAPPVTAAPPAATSATSSATSPAATSAATPLEEALEEIQIEGAEVLPEIMESLEQIDLTIGNIDPISLSLAPTPNKIPLVTVAMKNAADSASATLSEL